MHGGSPIIYHFLLQAFEVTVYVKEWKRDIVKTFLQQLLLNLAYDSTNIISQHIKVCQ